MLWPTGLKCRTCPWPHSRPLRRSFGNERTVVRARVRQPWRMISSVAMLIAVQSGCGDGASTSTKASPGSSTVVSSTGLTSSTPAAAPAESPGWTCKSLLPLADVRVAVGVSDVTVRAVDEIPANMLCIVGKPGVINVEIYVDSIARVGTYVDEIQSGERSGWAERQVLPNLGDRAFATDAFETFDVVVQGKGMVVEVSDGRAALSIEKVHLLAALVLKNLPAG